MASHEIHKHLALIELQVHAGDEAVVRGETLKNGIVELHTTGTIGCHIEALFDVGDYSMLANDDLTLDSVVGEQLES